MRKMKKKILKMEKNENEEQFYQDELEDDANKGVLNPKDENEEE